MHRLIDLVELEFGWHEKRIFRIELFEDTEKPNNFRARLWEIQSLPTDPRMTRETGPLSTSDKSMADKSSLLPDRFFLPFSAVDKASAMDEIVRDFTARWKAVNG